jgi:hypothetical protein
MRVFANGQMRENPDGLADGGKFIITRKRNENFVADAVDVDRCLSRQRAYEFAVKKRDHLTQRFINPASTQA